MGIGVRRGRWASTNGSTVKRETVPEFRCSNTERTVNDFEVGVAVSSVHIA
jgi:hypothetical protein